VVAHYSVRMSRGPGRLQRWLLVTLPSPGAVRQGRARSLSAGFLAGEFYATTSPTPAQRTGVRRALRGLEAAGLARRCDVETRDRGTSGWTRAAG
jgi:hypothetical protein